MAITSGVGGQGTTQSAGAVAHTKLATRHYESMTYTRSSTMAMPWPTPMHMVQSA